MSFLVATAVKLCMFALCCAACCVLVDRYVVRYDALDERCGGSRHRAASLRELARGAAVCRWVPAAILTATTQPSQMRWLRRLPRRPGRLPAPMDKTDNSRITINIVITCHTVYHFHQLKRLAQASFLAATAASGLGMPRPLGCQAQHPPLPGRPQARFYRP